MTTVQHKGTGSAEPVPATGTRSRWFAPALVVAAFLAIGGALGGPGGKLADVQKNDSAAYLPSRAESAAVLAASTRFSGVESTPAIVVYSRPSGLTDADKVEMTLFGLAVVEHLSPVLAGPPMGPIVAPDGTTAQVVVLLIGSDPKKMRESVDWLRQRATEAPGLETHVAGPAAALTDLTEVFGEVNGVLLAVTGLAILLILVLVYRSPVLPFVVLAVAGTALGMANGTAYLLAKAGLLTISGDAQGILDVLVLGAATDYALLLTARYREELRRHEDRYEAMRIAWRAAVEPIAASGGTVIAGLLCLLASGLASTRGLGPVAALGIGCALVSMLGALPAVLVLLGRFAFWPLRPRYDGGAPERQAWRRITRTVGSRPRLVWIATALALGGLAVGLTRLEAHGVPRTRSFLAQVDSNAGQAVLTKHFPSASATPAVIITNVAQLDAVLDAAQAVPGVTKAVAYVDPLEAYDRKQAGQPAPGPTTVDGLARVDVTVGAPADSARAAQVVRDLRRAVRSVPGAAARVGGYTAVTLDVQDTAARDRLVVIPLVLAVVLLILVLLLRAVVAPLVLIATVILSFAATLGVSGVVFRDVFGFAGADASFPLFAFVFLVALGVDYNIFLMTRVREEVARSGHRDGTLAGLGVTGGVITSAGVVLAATFSALALLPLVFLAELAFAVSFGVLLDTFVVRSLLVPAAILDLGRVSWWPGGLRRADP